MASIINASTSGVGGIITTADNTGDLNIQSGGSTKIAITSAGAAVTGTLSASGGITVGASAAPAFSVYLNTNQSISANTYTKISFDTEDFDTNNNFDTTTNRRFTPTIAGYYQFDLTACPYTNAGTSEVNLAFYKNGSIYSETRNSGLTTNYGLNNFSQLIYCNGSTDYIEFYIKVPSQASTIAGGGGFTYTRVSGFMARSA
jgi:hypothetical protein